MVELLLADGDSDEAAGHGLDRQHADDMLPPAIPFARWRATSDA